MRGIWDEQNSLSASTHFTFAWMSDFQGSTLSRVLHKTDLSRGRGFSKHFSCNRPSWISAHRKGSEQLQGLSHCWIGKVSRTEGRSKQEQCCGTWASQTITDSSLTALHLLPVQCRPMEKHLLSHTGQLYQYLLTLLYGAFREARGDPPPDPPLGNVLWNIMLLCAHTAYCFTSSAQQT